jgi:hypothetical protein
LRKPGQFIVSKVSRAPIGALGRNVIGVCARRKQLDRGVQICEIRPLARDPFFEVVNVAADFSALEAKGGDDMRRLAFLVRLSLLLLGSALKGFTLPGPAALEKFMREVGVSPTLLR